MSTLPRELRDHVHAQVLGDTVHLDLTKATANRLSLDGKLKPVETFFYIENKHSVQVEYVGAQFRSELISRFYKLAHIRIVDVEAMANRHVLKQIGLFGSEVTFAVRLQDVEFFIGDPSTCEKAKLQINEGIEALVKYGRKGCSDRSGRAGGEHHHGLDTGIS